MEVYLNRKVMGLNEKRQVFGNQEAYYVLILLFFVRLYGITCFVCSFLIDEIKRVN